MAEFPTTSLSGRSALVCGASMGIGRATARCLAAAGATVVAVARSQGALDDLVSEIAGSGGTAFALRADLDDRPALGAAIDRLLAERGPQHILINNTGGPKGGPLLAASEDELASAFGRHILAAHLLAGRLVPGMTAAGYGRIVNVISTSVREPIPNLGVSNTIRGAMASWAKSLSRELPPGVTINSVLPGFTDTARLEQLAQGRAGREGTEPDAVYRAWIAEVPEGRLALPEETASAIAWLCSPAAAFIRGVCLPVDGGRLRSI